MTRSVQRDLPGAPAQRRRVGAVDRPVRGQVGIGSVVTGHGGPQHVARALDCLHFAQHRRSRVRPVDDEPQRTCVRIDEPGPQARLGSGGVAGGEDRPLGTRERRPPVVARRRRGAADPASAADAADLPAELRRHAARRRASEARADEPQVDRFDESRHPLPLGLARPAGPDGVVPPVDRQARLFTRRIRRSNCQQIRRAQRVEDARALVRGDQRTGRGSPRSGERDGKDDRERPERRASERGLPGATSAGSSDTLVQRPTHQRRQCVIFL